MHATAIPFEYEIVVSVTRKGQLTIPAEARRFLDTSKHRKLAVVIKPDGSLTLRPPQYPSIESLAGAAGSLPDHLKGLSWQEIRAIAHEDLAQQILAKST